MEDFLVLAIGIVGILVAAGVAYDIATKQGVFLRPKLMAAFSSSFVFDPDDDAPARSADIVIVAIKRSIKSIVVVGLPLVIENAGKTAARKLLLQFEYPSELSVESHQNVMQSVVTMAFPESRKTYGLNGKTVVVHEFELVRPGETIVLLEPVAFDCTKFDASGAEVHLSYPTFLQSNAENVTKKSTHLTLGFFRADDEDEARSLASHVASEIYRSQADFATNLWTSFVSRVFRKIIKEIYCLSILPEFIQVSADTKPKDPAAIYVDQALSGEIGATAYAAGSLGIYISKLPSGKFLSRQEVKKMRRAGKIY